MGELSFVAVLEVHKVLSELFLQHQEALLDLDIDRAKERLQEFERRLLRHIWEEEELLLPVYGRAGTIPGGSPALFTGEHKKMKELLEDFNRRLSSLDKSRDGLKRGVLWLLDRQATFKNLMEHHNLREANILSRP